MNSEIFELIEELDDQQVSCIECKEMATMKSYLIKEAEPYKFIACTECFNCGHKDVFEEDYKVLDYGVRITCDFTDLSKIDQNVRRMAYIHKAADVTFIDSEGNELFSFSDSRSHVDCIQGIWMRGKDVLKTADEAESKYSDIFKKLDELKDKSGFAMIINDNSGYSRVAPFGLECIEIQNLTFEELNAKDKDVFYERIITKKESSK